MAGDWIKMEHWTPDKPEVFQIADQLQIDPDAVTGKLVRIWIWADQQTTNGNAVSVTRSLLDRLAGVTGFAKAMESAGWLTTDDGGIWFTNFDRHNGETAKQRALTAKRVAKTRNAKRNGDVTVPALPREEKRREEKNTKKEGESPLPQDRAQEDEPGNDFASDQPDRKSLTDEAAELLARWAETKGVMPYKSNGLGTAAPVVLSALAVVTEQGLDWRAGLDHFPLAMDWKPTLLKFLKPENLQNILDGAFDKKFGAKPKQVGSTNRWSVGSDGDMSDWENLK